MSHVFQAFLRRCNNHQQQQQHRSTSHERTRHPPPEKKPSSNSTPSSSSTHHTVPLREEDDDEDETAAYDHHGDEQDAKPRAMWKTAATTIIGSDICGRTTDDDTHNDKDPRASSGKSDPDLFPGREDEKETDGSGGRESRAALGSTSINTDEQEEDLVSSAKQPPPWPWPALPPPTEAGPPPSPDATTKTIDDDVTPQVGGTGLGSGWVCATCTLENASQRRRCAVCNGRRPIEFQTPPNRKRIPKPRHNDGGSSSSAEPSVVVKAQTRKSRHHLSGPPVTRSSKRPRTADLTGTPLQPPPDDATAKKDGPDPAPLSSRISTSPLLDARQAATTVAVGPIPPPSMISTPLDGVAPPSAALTAAPASSSWSTPPGPGGVGLVERYELEDRLLRGWIRRAQQHVVAGETLLENLKRQCREAQDRYNADRHELTLAQKQWQDFQSDYGAVRAAVAAQSKVPGAGGVGGEGETPHCTPLPRCALRSVASPIPKQFCSGGEHAESPVVPPTLQQLHEVASKLAAAEPVSRPSPIDSQATIDPDLDGATGGMRLLGHQIPPAPDPNPPLGRPGAAASMRLDSSLTRPIKPPPLSVSTNRRTAMDASPVVTVPVPPAVGGAPLPGWDSTKPSRDFVAPRRLPSSTTDVPSSKYHTATAAATGDWIQAAKGARREHRARQQQPPSRSPSRDSLWDGGAASDQSSSSSSAPPPPPPEHPYHEVVRGRRQRDRLPRHDCYCCRDFYAALDPADALALLSHSRHRAQHSPSETPQDFWVVDFVDELEREADLARGDKKVAGSAAAEPVPTAAAAVKRRR